MASWERRRLRFGWCIACLGGLGQELALLCTRDSQKDQKLVVIGGSQVLQDQVAHS